MRLRITQEHLDSKGTNNQSEETSNRMRALFTTCLSDKGLRATMCQPLSKMKSKNTTDAVKKRARDLLRQVGNAYKRAINIRKKIYSTPPAIKEVLTKSQ